MKKTTRQDLINQRTEKKYKIYTIRIFFITLLIIGAVGLLFPLRPKESDIEKRELTKFPKPTVSTFFNGEFFNDISTWYADTFPFREHLISANAKLQQFYGIRKEEIHGEIVEGDAIPDADAEMSTEELPEVTPEPTPAPDGAIHVEPEKAGTIYVADNVGFELYGFSRDGADQYINMMNSVAKQLSGVATVYDIVVPTSIAVNLDLENQSKIGSADQGKAIEYVYGHLDPSIKAVSVLETLINHNSEYLYFHTDHHWTADGAYYAYEEFMKTKGGQAAPLSSYTKNEYEGFIGSFYSYSNQSEALKSNPDTVVTYTPQVNTMTYTDTQGETYDWNVVADATTYTAANKYLCFIGGDQPYSRIENPNITDGSSCVVVKESYANAFIPFLVNSYQTVHIVDYRYYQDNLVKLVKDNKIQDVIYLNNTNALIESAVGKMAGIVRPEVTPTPSPSPSAAPASNAAATPEPTKEP